MKLTDNTEMFSIFQCPHCLGSCTPSEIYASRLLPDTRSGIIRCKCREYPLLFGVLGALPNADYTRIISCIKNRNELGALFLMLESNIRTKILFVSILYLFKFLRIIRGESIHSFIRLDLFLRLLRLASYPREWSNYVLNRKRMPSYIMSVFASHVAKPYVKITDVGCGVGTLLPQLYQKTNPENVYGLDKSFANLVLARIYFAHPKSVLVCMDLEARFPIQNSTIGFVISVDCFHYIHHQTLFINEISRISGPLGKVAVIHVLNNKNSAHGNAYGLSPETIRRTFRKNNFTDIVQLSHQSFWDNIHQMKRWRFVQSDKMVIIQKAYAFSVLCSRGKSLPLCRWTALEYRQLNETPVFWHFDKPLYEHAVARSLLNSYDRFIFLSPHLDDAVLSCESLIHALLQNHKKIIVATVFTEASPPPFTNQAKSFMKTCGYTDAGLLFRDRRREDINALTRLGCGWTHLGFIDAAWRKTFLYSGAVRFRQLIGHLPGIVHVYPDPTAQFSGRTSFWDYLLKKQLDKQLRGMEHDAIRTLFLAPLGIGGHADHTLVHNAARKLKTPVLYWEDHPYNSLKERYSRYMANDAEPLHQVLEYRYKRGASSSVRWYKTYSPQEKHWFPGGKPYEVTEKYYSKSSLC